MLHAILPVGTVRKAGSAILPAVCNCRPSSNSVFMVFKDFNLIQDLPVMFSAFGAQIDWARTLI
jgi:hypothetical protein